MLDSHSSDSVIENYQALKEQLIQDGDTDFRSDTDTEVLAHLIGKLYIDSCATTVDVEQKRNGWSVPYAPPEQVIGALQDRAPSRGYPGFIVGARAISSPLVLGVGKDSERLPGRRP